MLPGFRFLFAATVLSISMLIFGLGAAALLRAAHQEFASIPSRRALPEVMFTQQSDDRPALAMLRVEPSADEKIPDVQIASPMEQSGVASAAPEPATRAADPDTIAALTQVAAPAENSSTESAKPEASTPAHPVQAETPAPADTSSSAVEIKVATSAETPTALPEQASAVDDSSRIAETRIATLGGPPVTIETQPPSKTAPAVVRKSTQAKRAVTRRRITQRARVVRPAPQQPANPFGTRFGS
jgi:hypothetical protein